MESCKEQVKLKDSMRRFIYLECAEGKWHDGQHVATVWTDQKNEETGKRGLLTYFYWGKEK